MRALAYLLLTQIKNKIVMLKKKPAMLILYCFIITMILLSIVAIILSGKAMQKTKFADERIIFLILAGIGLLFLYTFCMTGLSTGSSLFTMPDVGLLFVSPISSKKILLYGLLSTLGKSLLGSIFIFYQVGNLRSNFGFGFTEILALFLIFALLIMFCQLLSIGIYIYSNGNQVRKNAVKGLVYGLFAVLILAVIILQKQEQLSLMEALLRTASSDWFGFVPVAGWATMFFIGMAQKTIASVILSLALFAVMGIIIISLLTVGKADYYEDVLISTEFTFQTKLAAREGRKAPVQKKRTIKVKDNEPGIGKGIGAMTLMYKHLLELRRKSRFVFIDGYTIFIMVGVILVGNSFKEKEELDIISYGVLSIVIYFQYFLTVMGKLKEELMKPFIYLIPESSIKKVLAASMTSLIKPCIDGLLFFVVYSLITGIGIMAGIFFCFAYAASGAVFVGITIMYQRVLGGQPNRIIQGFLGFGLFLGIMTPPIGASVLVAFLLPSSLQFLCLLPYTIFCLLLAALLFVTCGNLIDKADYTGKA